MKNKKIKALNLTMIFIFWSLIFNAKVQIVKADSRKEILIINSYDINQTWERNIEDVLEAPLIQISK